MCLCTWTLRSPSFPFAYNRGAGNTPLVHVVCWGAAASGTNGASPLDKDETGRVSPHSHDISDPGHDHSYKLGGGDTTSFEYPLDNGPGSQQKSVEQSVTGITIQENNGEDLPLFYVLICQKM